MLIMWLDSVLHELIGSEKTKKKPPAAVSWQRFFTHNTGEQWEQQEAQRGCHDGRLGAGGVKRQEEVAWREGINLAFKSSTADKRRRLLNSKPLLQFHRRVDSLQQFPVIQLNKLLIPLKAVIEYPHVQTHLLNLLHLLYIELLENVFFSQY